MNTESRYSIGELAQLAGTTVRTIRYYTDEGLLPQPQLEGKYAYYTRAYVDRLELIRRMKEAYLPLKEIRQVMLSLSDEEVRRQLHESTPALHNTLLSKNLNQPGSSALEYLRQVQESRVYFKPAPGIMRKGVASPTTQPGTPLQTIQSPSRYGVPSSEAWSRYVIDDGVELNVREPLTTESAGRVQQILAYARRLFQSK